MEKRRAAWPAPPVALADTWWRCRHLTFQQLLDFLNQHREIGAGEGEFGRGNAVTLDVRRNVLACPELAEGWYGPVGGQGGLVGRDVRNIVSSNTYPCEAT